MKTILLTLSSIMTISASAAVTNSDFNDDYLENKVEKIIPVVKADREDKKYSAELILLGAAHNSTTYGFRGSYFMDEDKIASLEYLHLTNRTLKQNINDGDLGHVIGANIKKFYSDSFFIKPGAYYKDQTRHEGTEFNFKTGSQAGVSPQRSKDLGISFSIGNQWQWKNLVIGCDWVGITANLINLETSGDGNVEDPNLEGTILNLYLGASF